MKIAFPTDGNNLDAQIVPHFGRAKNFLIFDTATQKYKILPNTSEHYGGKKLPPELLQKAKVDTVICTGLGPKAEEMLKKLNIKVYQNIQGAIKKNIQSF